MSKTILIILFFSLTKNGHAGLFGPSNYDECILENTKGIASDDAANLVRQACRDKFDAIELEKLKAQAKNGNMDAQEKLGSMYYEGKGVVKDFMEAVKWTKLAALQGLPLAQYHLGYLYYNGYGVMQDYKEAVKW